MITEDYVSFETAKLLKEKGFQAKCTACYHSDINHTFELISGRINYCNPRFSKYKMIPPYNAPTLQMVMRWLREVHNVLVIPDYDYECTDKSYCYKIYKLGENGKPERVPIEGVRYDTLGEPHTEIVSYRDYKRSYFDYKTYEEACEAGIKYCLENLI